MGQPSGQKCGQALRQAVLVLQPITDTSRLEAEVLLAHILCTSRTWLLAHLDHPLTLNQLTDYKTLIRRRAADYPLPYLTSRAEFYGLEFEVTPDVFIPRPETETLVDLALTNPAISQSPDLPIIADVGTGCGCIAVALAVHLLQATVCATDVSPAALAVARRNAEHHHVADRVHLLAGDLLEPCPVAVDLIVSNPPYVAEGEFAALPLSVREHEPRLALDGGPDGLAVIRRLLAQAPATLKPDGALLIEIGASQGEATSRLAREHFPTATIRTHPDLAGRDRALEVAQAFEPADRLESLSHIRLVVLDMDGTLIGSDLVVSSRARRAIATAQERGVAVTLATGRMFDFVQPFARDLGITTPFISYQGGLIKAADAAAPIYRATMEQALVQEVLELCDQRGWRLVLYADEEVYLTERDRPESFYRYMLGERLVWVDNLAAVIEQHEPLKFIIFVEPRQAAGVEAELRQRFDGRMSVVRSHEVIIEGNPLGATKVDALRRLAAHLGIPQAEVMAVGDQDNDAAMIAWAGVGVAMGNGSPAAKAAADWIAPPFEEDGAAVAIERFVLNR
jgi:release factor glutamine methyltransferase